MLRYYYGKVFDAKEVKGLIRSWSSSGVIRKATWEESVLNSIPHVKLEIEVVPFYLGGRSITRLFKGISVVTPLLSGLISPLRVLEEAADVRIKVDLPIKLGQEIPELVGKRIHYGMRLVELDGVEYPHITRLYPKSKVKEVEKLILRDLPVGEMFRRTGEQATYRYFKTNIKKEEPGSGYYCCNLDGKSEGYFMPGTTPVIRLEPDVDCSVTVLSPTEPGYKRPGPFFMNYVQGAGMPSMRHPDQAIACGEAERLAKCTGKRVFVMRTTHSVIYKPPLPIPSGMHWNRFREDC